MDYEKRISQRRAENRQFLKELGILNANIDLKQNSPAKKSISLSKRKVKLEANLRPTRRSNRIQKIEPAQYNLEELLDENDDLVVDTKYVAQKTSSKVKRENTFGAIPGVAVGTEFTTRIEASAAGIHRPTVAGIHGNPSLGCYSLALSGGYEDDVDLGESFVYTGEGGRDLKGTKANPKNLRTAPQSKDQVLERGNLALSKNIENDVPVRVLRGYKLRSEYAPTEGYRYDGLYKVTKYYLTKGKSGFNVYKFQLERIKEQEPAPWLNESDSELNGREED